MSESALILLAAGSSSRMGAPKQVLDFRRKPLLRHAAEVAVATGCSPIVVVLGARATELRPMLANLPVQVVVNDQWSEGIGTSIRAGVRAVADHPVGAILALAYQPFVKPEALRALVDKHRETTLPIVASRYEGTVGVPVFFSASLFDTLLALEPTQSCKGVILSHAAETLLLDCPDGAIDIDTPEDYRNHQ